MSIKKLTYELGLRYKRNQCMLKSAGIETIDYKDVELLKEFITEKGKIIPRRVSNISAKKQKMLTESIKRARNIALISFDHGYIGPDDKPIQSIYTDNTRVSHDTEADDEVSTEDETSGEE